MKLREHFLTTVNNVTCERPQHFYMKIALGIHGDDVNRVLETYDLLSTHYIVHSFETTRHISTDRQHVVSGTTQERPYNGMQCVPHSMSQILFDLQETKVPKSVSIETMKMK